MKNRPLPEKQAKKQENRKTGKPPKKPGKNRKTRSVGTLLAPDPQILNLSQISYLG